MVKSIRSALSIGLFCFVQILYAEPADNLGTVMLSIEEFAIGKGCERTIYVDMENPDDIISTLSFKIKLPDGITVKTVNGKSEIKAVAERLSKQVTSGVTTYNHTLQSSVSSDGVISVMITPAKPDNTFVGTSGHIVSITLQADKDAMVGKKILYLKEISFTHPDISTVKQENTHTIVSVNNAGDVNNDKVVDIVDLADVIDYMRNNTPKTNFDATAADMNGDGKITLDDIEKMKQTILAR